MKRCMMAGSSTAAASQCGRQHCCCLNGTARSIAAALPRASATKRSNGRVVGHLGHQRVWPGTHGLNGLDIHSQRG